MKKLIAMSMLLVSSVSQADIISCQFTEPFISTTYSMTQSTLTVKEGSDEQVIKNVSFQIKAAGVFELVSSDKKVLQVLKVTGDGSDGMSDTVYPYDAQYGTLRGGCSSNYLPAVTNY